MVLFHIAAHSRACQVGAKIFHKECQICSDLDNDHKNEDETIFLITPTTH